MRVAIKFALGLLSFTLTSLAAFAQSGLITTYAGPALPQSGLPAITQAIDQPGSLLMDGAGGFYVSATRQARIYRVAADGRLTVIAGSGTRGTIGDGGPATAAQLSNPIGLALDPSGNLYIADNGSSRIRKVTPSGAIITIAGGGPGLVLGDGGPATDASLISPGGLAFDSAGNLYIADSGHHRIRRVSTGGVISTVAGTGTAGFSGDKGPATAAQLNWPDNVAIDAFDNLYITDSENHRIRRVSVAGVIDTAAGNGEAGFSGDGGPAIAAQLNYPSGISVDAAGSLYISDAGNNRVRKVTVGGVISTVAGSGEAGFSGDGGPATTAQFDSPVHAVSNAGGEVYVADFNNRRVRKISLSGVISTVAGNGTSGFSGDGGPATSAQMKTPSGVATDSAGNVYIADTNNHRIRKVSAGGVISTIAGTGIAGTAGDGGQAKVAQLNSPLGVAVSAAGNIYIAEQGSNRIRMIATGGVISTVAGTGTAGFGGDGGQATLALLRAPSGVVVDSAGNLYIADRGNNRIRKVTSAGVISTVAGSGVAGSGADGGQATSAPLRAPAGVAVDPAGNVYIADQGNNRIRKVTTGGVISTVAGGGSPGHFGDGGPATSATLRAPTGVVVDSAGNLYIADTSDHRVRKVTNAGVISTLAGLVLGGFTGDGGPASKAELDLPSGVALDSAVNLYIADSNAHRIRKIAIASLVTINVQTEPVGLTYSVDGVASSGVGPRFWTPGSVHTIAVASPQDLHRERYLFVNWSDGGAITHTVSAPASDTTYTAHFTENPQLALTVTPEAGGSIVASPVSSDGYYPMGTVVQLTAVPNAGYIFSSWSGDLTGTTTTQSVTMSYPRSATARFASIQGSSTNLSLISGGAARYYRRQRRFHSSRLCHGCSQFRPGAIRHGRV